MSQKSGYSAVSTHSRPKAAGVRWLPPVSVKAVSTHSRPKAAGFQRRWHGKFVVVSTHSRPKAAGKQVIAELLIPEVSTHSRPKAAGLFADALGCGNFGFNTQPPEGGWLDCSDVASFKNWFQHTAARRRLGLAV